MAYISHSQYRAYSMTGRADVAAMAAILGRSALVAIAAGAVVVALSGASTVAEHGVAMKTDRLAGPISGAQTVAFASEQTADGAEIRRDTQGRVVYVNDPASQTTTVARGASVPLTSSSPLGDGSR